MDHSEVCQFLGIEEYTPRPDLGSWIQQRTPVEIAIGAVIGNMTQIMLGGSFHCRICGQVVNPWAESKCPKCGAKDTGGAHE